MQCGTNCAWWTNRHLHGIYFECLSPKLIAQLGGPICTNLVGCSECKAYEPLVFPDFEWAVVVTAMRDRIYLNDTIASLLAADLDGVICYDSNPPRGPFTNFYAAATEMYLQKPFATAYIFCQDDIEVEPDAKMIVEEIGAGKLPPILSLYTAPELKQFTKGNESRAPKFEDEIWDHWRIINQGHDSPGACCYVFSAIGLRDFLTDPIVLAHKRSANGWRDIDGIVGVWATKHGGIWHYVGPGAPLVKHVGKVSSIDK